MYVRVTFATNVYLMFLSAVNARKLFTPGQRSSRNPQNKNIHSNFIIVTPATGTSILAIVICLKFDTCEAQVLLVPSTLFITLLFGSQLNFYSGYISGAAMHIHLSVHYLGILSPFVLSYVRFSSKTK